MADYLPQADPGGTCCSCASRSNPCSNCSACFFNANIKVSFSGVTIDCGCVDTSPESSSCASASSVDFGINTTYTLPLVFSEPGHSSYSLTLATTCTTIKAYGAVTNCSGTFDNCDQGVTISVDCYDGSGALPAGIYPAIVIESTSCGLFLVYFYHRASPTGTLTGISNTVTCAQHVNDNFLGNMMGIAHGGTCSITLL